MLGQEYKEISPELLKQAYGNAYSIENMEAHGAAGRRIDYKGSRRAGNIIYDYYRDDTGAWWYENRAVVNGCIVSMEVYIFGKDLKKARTPWKNKNT